MPAIPVAPSIVGWKRLRADVVQLEWECEGSAHTLDCELQYREKQLSGFVSWKTCLVDAAAAEVDPDTEQVQRWRYRLKDLRTSTTYVARVKARNAAGWSAGFSDPAMFRSSEPPAAPKSVACVERGPTHLKLEVEVDNPDGAPVSGLLVERATLVSFEPLSAEAGAAPRVQSLVLRNVDDRAGVLEVHL